MRITNRNNLPAPLVSAVSDARRPSPDSISVTELINPPQMRLLSLAHWDAIEEDASDRLWATMGTLMHTLLERHAGGGEHLSEMKLSTTVEGRTVTGTFDLFHESGTLFDYKFVSVWTTREGLKDEWVAQLNCYAGLLRGNGYNVTGLKLVAIYRDWTKSKAFEHGYPSSQVEVFDVPLWTSEQATLFLQDRVTLHMLAENGSINAECTPEERWARPTKYALMRRGRKTAVKLYDSPEEARVEACMPDLYVETRPGASVRCESYCRVSAFCPQFAAMKAAG